MDNINGCYGCIRLTKYNKCNFEGHILQCLEAGNCDKYEIKLKVFIEDAEDFMRESQVYRKVLEHRRTCEKWGKCFCLECFGGGLTLFTKNLQKESLAKSKSTTSQRK